MTTKAVAPATTAGNPAAAKAPRPIVRIRATVVVALTLWLSTVSRTSPNHRRGGTCADDDTDQAHPVLRKHRGKLTCQTEKTEGPQPGYPAPRDLLARAQAACGAEQQPIPSAIASPGTLRDQSTGCHASGKRRVQVTPAAR